ncbi:MAG: UDP-N-acetylmuramate--alanine ligase [Candidatus Omnitrophota bacterium]|jgi:UDP-N-acetylmuramate--alanine ligase
MYNHYHFIGIGGIGMSAIAQMLLHHSIKVSGSDLNETALTQSIRGLGADIFIGHQAAAIQGAECIVYSTSIDEKNIELVLAKELGIPILHRSELLAQLCSNYWSVAIAGTHGKSTTTAMLAAIFKTAHRQPTIVVGAKMVDCDSNFAMGKGDEIIFEADESDESFLAYKPNGIIVTNIDCDHMDYFKDLKAIESAFDKFVNQKSEHGHWVGCGDCPQTLKLLKKYPNQAISYGFGAHCDYYIQDMHITEPAGMKFSWLSAEGGGGIISLKLRGRHNALNALAAMVMARTRRIDQAAIIRGLASFEGIQRRYQTLLNQTEPQCQVIDDYAHHPVEVKATLDIALSMNIRPLRIVLQPHRYTRVKAFAKEFAQNLLVADEVIITDIYSASEKPLPGISPNSIIDIMHALGNLNAHYVPKNELVNYFDARANRNGLILFMGAGDISQIAKQVAHVSTQRISA